MAGLDSIGILLPAALITAAATGLWLARQAAARRTARAGYLDLCRALFDAPPLDAIAPHGFPRFSGRIGGVLHDVQVVPEALGMRKLPALWLLVSRLQPREAGVVDVLRRPAGTEPFTRFGQLPCSVVAPAGFPEDCAVRADRPPSMPPPWPALARAMDPRRMKELVLDPRGLRLVWLAEEADRGRFLIFRDAELGRTPLDPAVLARMTQALARLASDLPRPGAVGETAAGAAA